VGNGTSFGLNDLEAPLTVAHQANEWISAHALDVPLALPRAFRSSSPLVKGVAEAALYCAHRTSTVSPCAFCEQEGRLAAPSPPLPSPPLPSPPHPTPLAVLSSNP
jgi:hypothetical protein